MDKETEYACPNAVTAAKVYSLASLVQTEPLTSDRA